MPARALVRLTRAFGVALAVPMGMLSTGASLAAQGGRWSAALDGLTHFAPFWLAGGLATLAAGFVLTRGVWRGILYVLGVAALAGSVLLIAPEYLRDRPPPASRDAPGQIKLIQFNTWYSARDLSRTIDWIAAQNADIVVLEEPRPGLGAAIARRSGHYVTCDGCSVTILSRARPVESGVRGYPLPASTYATFRDARGAYTVIGVHHSWPTPDGRQEGQSHHLAAYVRQFRTDRLLIAGDFNSTPWSFARRRADQAIGVPRRTRALFSWPARAPTSEEHVLPFPFLPIDHVYAGRDWRTVRVQRGPRLDSDHYPVIVRLAPA